MSDTIFCKLVSPTLIEVTEVLPAGRITCSIRKGMAEAFRLDHIPPNVCEITIPFERIENLYYAAAEIKAHEWREDTNTWNEAKKAELEDRKKHDNSQELHTL